MKNAGQSDGPPSAPRKLASRPPAKRVGNLMDAREKNSFFQLPPEFRPWEARPEVNSNLCLLRFFWLPRGFQLVVRLRHGQLGHTCGRGFRTLPKCFPQTNHNNSP